LFLVSLLLFPAAVASLKYVTSESLKNLALLAGLAIPTIVIAANAIIEYSIGRVVESIINDIRAAALGNYAVPQFREMRSILDVSRRNLAIFLSLALVLVLFLAIFHVPGSLFLVVIVVSLLLLIGFGFFLKYSDAVVRFKLQYDIAYFLLACSFVLCLLLPLFHSEGLCTSKAILAALARRSMSFADIALVTTGCVLAYLPAALFAVVIYFEARAFRGERRKSFSYFETLKEYRATGGGGVNSTYRYFLVATATVLLALQLLGIYFSIGVGLHIFRAGFFLPGTTNLASVPMFIARLVSAIHGSDTEAGYWAVATPYMLGNITPLVFCLWLVAKARARYSSWRGRLLERHDPVLTGRIKEFFSSTVDFNFLACVLDSNSGEAFVVPAPAFGDPPLLVVDNGVLHSEGRHAIIAHELVHIQRHLSKLFLPSRVWCLLMFTRPLWRSVFNWPELEREAYLTAGEMVQQIHGSEGVRQYIALLKRQKYRRPSRSKAREDPQAKWYDEVLGLHVSYNIYPPLEQIVLELREKCLGGSSSPNVEIVDAGRTKSTQRTPMVDRASRLR